MTRQEAIAVLESDAEYMYSQDSPYCREAYRMAVEALKAESCQQRTNADYIRAMTDEELAEFIAQQRFCVINPIADKLKIGTTTAFIQCKENMTMWLKQGVKE